jgi:hypothetical protein
MLDFMHEGGFAMWPALVVALVSVGWAWTSPLAQRAGVLCGGAVLVVGLGVLGFSLGIHATVHGLQAAGSTIPAADHVKLLAQGLRESANNGVLSGGLVVMLGALAFMVRHHATSSR